MNQDALRKIIAAGEVDMWSCAEDSSTEEMIREAAYYNWLNAGQPTGRDQEFWNEAERQIVGFTVDEMLEAEREHQAELRELEQQKYFSHIQRTGSPFTPLGNPHTIQAVVADGFPDANGNFIPMKLIKEAMEKLQTHPVEVKVGHRLIGHTIPSSCRSLASPGRIQIGMKARITGEEPFSYGDDNEVALAFEMKDGQPVPGSFTAAIVKKNR